MIHLRHDAQIERPLPSKIITQPCFEVSPGTSEAPAAVATALEVLRPVATARVIGGGLPFVTASAIVGNVGKNVNNSMCDLTARHRFYRGGTD